MPINPNSLGVISDLEERAAAAKVAADASDGATNEHEGGSQEPPKRARRSKKQMIADAVVPADDEQVALKDLSTGAKVERPWLVALEVVRDGKMEFADKAMKHAMQKYDQQKASSAFETIKADEAGPTAEDATSGEPEETTPSANVPPEAEIGDEVVVGSTVFRVGHGRVLVEGIIAESGDSSKIIHAARRWQRELGAGVDGEWESTTLRQAEPARPKVDGNGHSDHVPAPVALPEGVEIEQVGLRGWRVGTGVLEKIGLPDYSSLQIGPITASREVLDDGRRTTVTVGDREAVIPTACIEIAQQAMDIVEYIARYQRGELVSFLESTGALKQPVS